MIADYNFHAGTANGAQCFGVGQKNKKVKMTDFPAPFCGLPADDLEDILCIYKRQLKNDMPPLGKELPVCVFRQCDVGQDAY